MSAVLLDPTPVPEIMDGMIVRVIYLGQEKIRYVDNEGKIDPAARMVFPEWWDGERWVGERAVCSDPFVDSRGHPKVLHDGIPYRMECGKDTFMPIECARLWFGDERAKQVMDTGLNRKALRVWVNDRATEVRRLRCLYDNRLGDELQIIGHPIVEVYTLEDGSRVPMVLDDPLGINSTPASMSQADETDLRRILAKQAAQITQMQRQLDAQTTGPGRSRAPAPKRRAEQEDDEESEELVGLGRLPEDPNG